MANQTPMGELRRSQIITTYGPGSLVPVEDASYIILGLDHWDAESVDLELREPRLERHLGVARFHWPPSSQKEANARDIPVARFPRMYTCSTCHALARYRDLATADAGLCVNCAGRLVTSRFVMVCESGHISDFPYHRWAHHKNHEEEGPGHQLRLTSRGQSAALSDLYVECSCGVSRSLEGALGRSALRPVTRCDGNQPWLRSSDPERCEATPRGMQRGASNVWQGITASSISIPPWSDEACKFVDRYWAMLGNVPEAVREDVVRSTIAANHLRLNVDEVLSVINERLGLAAGPAPTTSDLRIQEYEALKRGRDDQGRGQDFVCLKPGGDEVLPNGVTDLRLVTRLREVRALTGFKRQTNSTDEQRKAPLSRQQLSWLPAIEVSGEGVFVSLDPDRVVDWERDPRVSLRLNSIAGTHDSYGRPYQDDHLASPRRVLVHTLAHVLIDQWSLECGYPAASLRERLYVNDEMAALLIYTATSDSAGSLGGVVGMAKGGKFARSFNLALERATWCSNDPLCMESGATGVNARNLGACHACVLLPETSCELENSLLDRGLLIGTVDGCPGFFSSASTG